MSGHPTYLLALYLFVGAWAIFGIVCYIRDVIWFFRDRKDDER